MLLGQRYVRTRRRNRSRVRERERRERFADFVRYFADRHNENYRRVTAVFVGGFFFVLLDLRGRSDVPHDGQCRNVTTPRSGRAR